MLCIRICEWLQQIAHLNISMHAHKYSNEPATTLPQLCKSCASLAGLLQSFVAVVIGFLASFNLQLACFMAVVWQLTAITTIAVGISLPSSVQAEKQVFKVRGHHLGISTSGFFPFGRTTLPSCLLDSWTPKTLV